MRVDISDEYFEWLFDLVCSGRFSRRISYRNLLTQLHDTEFRYSISKDRNRAEDGKELRHQFALIHDEDLYDTIADALDGPCSVLEMMIALAIRCEEGIMDDPLVGDRTGQWFWGMVNNLGLGSMADSRYDEKYVDEVIERFLNREYERNGRGGLFIIKNCKYDLRDVEIWYQMCWYLDTLYV